MGCAVELVVGVCCGGGGRGCFVTLFTHLGWYMMVSGRHHKSLGEVKRGVSEAAERPPLFTVGTTLCSTTRTSCACPHSFARSLAHSLARSPTHSLTRPLTRPLARSPARSLTRPHAQPRARTNSVARSSRPRARSLAHSLSAQPARRTSSPHRSARFGCSRTHPLAHSLTRSPAQPLARSRADPQLGHSLACLGLSPTS